MKKGIVILIGSIIAFSLGLTGRYVVERSSQTVPIQTGDESHVQQGVVPNSVSNESPSASGLFYGVLENVGSFGKTQSNSTADTKDTFSLYRWQSDASPKHLATISVQKDFSEDFLRFRRFAFSSTGRLAVADNSKAGASLKMIDVSSGGEPKVFPLPAGWWIDDIIVSPDGQYAALHLLKKAQGGLGLLDEGQLRIVPLDGSTQTVVAPEGISTGFQFQLMRVCNDNRRIALRTPAPTKNGDLVEQYAVLYDLIDKKTVTQPFLLSRYLEDKGYSDSLTFFYRVSSNCDRYVRHINTGGSSHDSYELHSITEDTVVPLLDGQSQEPGFTVFSMFFSPDDRHLEMNGLFEPSDTIYAIIDPENPANTLYFTEAQISPKVGDINWYGSRGSKTPLIFSPDGASFVYGTQLGIAQVNLAGKTSSVLVKNEYVPSVAEKQALECFAFVVTGDGNCPTAPNPEDFENGGAWEDAVMESVSNVDMKSQRFIPLGWW